MSNICDLKYNHSFENEIFKNFFLFNKEFFIIFKFKIFS